ncbi:MAG TPA: TetR family transcriptional regulator C-terminal domain-containing protein [Planctomycetota bacterium]|nr:TetR family transcriptional regulator C-terminal domain-containing protein [Planctomycetota bacterium]
MIAKSTRATIVSVASQLLRVQGFHSTGIDAVLKQAKVPKGSFYHYFRSKDDLGLAIIEQAAQELALKLAHHFGNQALTPLGQLRAYFEATIEAQRQSECTRGCLFGTLGLELASHSSGLRQRIDEVLGEWERQVAACLTRAQASGELAERFVATELAAFILSSWEGAILRSKVAKSVAPLQQFVDLLFRQILQ